MLCEKVNTFYCQEKMGPCTTSENVTTFHLENQ